MFSAIYDYLIQEDKENDRYRLNKIVLLNAANGVKGDVEKGFTQSVECLYKDPLYCGARCMLSKIRLDRGILWQNAVNRWYNEMLPKRFAVSKLLEGYRDKLLEDINAGRIKSMGELNVRENKLKQLCRKVNALVFEGFYFFRPQYSRGAKEVVLVRFDFARNCYEIHTPHRGVQKNWSGSGQIKPSNVLNEDGGFYRIRLISQGDKEAAVKAEIEKKAEEKVKNESTASSSNNPQHQPPQQQETGGSSGLEEFDKDENNRLLESEVFGDAVEDEGAATDIEQETPKAGGSSSAAAQPPSGKRQNPLLQGLGGVGGNIFNAFASSSSYRYNTRAVQRDLELARRLVDLKHVNRHHEYFTNAQFQPVEVNRGKSCSELEIRNLWNRQFTMAGEGKCVHIQRNGFCNKTNCRDGLRIRFAYLLHGAFLEVWNIVSGTIGGKSSKGDDLADVFGGDGIKGKKGPNTSKLKMVKARIQQEDNNDNSEENTTSIVGLSIESDQKVETIRKILRSCPDTIEGVLQAQSANSSAGRSEDSAEAVCDELVALRGILSHFEHLHKTEKSCDEYGWKSWLDAHESLIQRQPSGHIRCPSLRTPAGMGATRRAFEGLTKSGRLLRRLVGEGNSTKGFMMDDFEGTRDYIETVEMKAARLRNVGMGGNARKGDDLDDAPLKRRKREGDVSSDVSSDSEGEDIGSQDSFSGDEEEEEDDGNHAEKFDPNIDMSDRERSWMLLFPPFFSPLKNHDFAVLA